MSEMSEDVANESILYEVLEYLVRKQEPELTKYKNDLVALPTPGTIKNALRYLNNRYSLPEIISQQISFTLPWKFAVGDRGRILAILQENIIEIRKSKDEYSSVIGKASAPKDAFPQWRKLAWSPDGSILALASSNGYISFYNSFGNNLFNISPKSDSQNPDILEAGDAIASMIFKKPRVKSDNWDYEFIRVTYSGLLKSYCISGNSFSENHEFSFGSFYRNGVNFVLYSEKHNLFFIAGNSVSQNLSCTASQIGLTCWRTLNDHPYYKLSVASQDVETYKSNFLLWSYIPVIKNKTQPLIFKTSVSPNNQLIACLHVDGTISVWSLPSLKQQNQWKLSDQMHYDAENPLKSMKFKKPLANISEFQPLDIGWWSDNAVIVTRYSGAVSVCSINNLMNLLGNSPEFLYNCPQIAELGESKGFLCLDCEVIVTSTKRNRETNTDELSSDDEKDEEEPKQVTILNYLTNLVQSILFTITDMERFQPKRKRSKVFHRTYRLIGLKSTTPEELYSRKIEIEDYKEALALAKKYNLDPDLVYQTQWRKSEFCVNAIQEHLSKVSKRSWVLNECVSRVPETLEATKELINFGLCGANLETLIAIGKCDDGKFTSAEVEEVAGLDESTKQLKQMQKINQTLETIDKERLTESQKELIRYRKKLLSHLDKLQTYELLLESPSKFDKKFYEEFRRLSPVQNAVKFAKSFNCKGVETMFTYYGAQLMPHWLAIISFFPETLEPGKYQKLLPECDMDGRLFLLYQKELRQKDWVERSMFDDITNSDNNEYIEYIYECKKSLTLYRDKELTMDLLQKWYSDRAYEIERESRLVENALALVNIGKSHNIQNLENLLFELETLDDLVYKVGLEELSLTEMEKLDDLKKIKLLMSKSSENNFVDNIKNMLLPYSRRRKRYLGDSGLERDLLYDYLVMLSKSDLELPVRFFEFMKTSCDPEILDAIESITALAVDCVYACNDVDMYDKAKAIFDATEGLASGREDSIKKYKELEKELRCLQILSKYQVYIPLHRLRDCRQDSSEAKELLIPMSENLIKINPQANEKHWSQMLNDTLDIQEQTFNCLDIETCFEISMLARLKSKSKSAIQGCTNLMEIKKSGRSHLKVSHERAIDFVLEASNNYFNNSKSLTDPYMDLARECLHLITDNDERISEEYDLIESLQILSEFNISILPLQVRIMSERLKLIEDCLNSRRDAYKSKQKLLNLAKYLRVERKNSRLREGKILNLIARKAFEVRDYGFCSAVLRDMMKSNYQSAWDTARDLGYCDEFDDLQFRKNCIWFAVHHGPSSALESLMQRANLLEVQILNADLAKMMPDLESEEEPEAETSVANDCAGAAFTALTENKEFVPKIMQTSTDLVKSSAQIVTQSTFDLIRSARSKDFWTSKLNFNFLEGNQQPKATIVADDEIIPTKVIKDAPKFCCFYESIHEGYGISEFDTNYSKYSVDDYDAKLKLARTLLRISMLSETASYGAEVSDINHLLVECAERTIKEDCLMGISYLLDLPDEYLTNVEQVFNSLPKTKLYSQLFAYFYSVKLHSKLYADWKNVFLYKPTELILQMSNAQISSEDSYQVKLKQNIDLSLTEKQEEDLSKESAEAKEEDVEVEVKSDIVDTAKLETVNNNNNNNFEVKEKKLTLEYIPASNELGGWDDWDDKENFEIAQNSNASDEQVVPEKTINDNGSEKQSKLSLDYTPAVTDELGGWDSWSDKENDETEVNVASTVEVVSLEEQYDVADKFKIVKDLDHNQSAEELGGWDDWDEKENSDTIDNIKSENDEATVTDKNCSDEKLVADKKSSLDYVPISEDVDDWGNWTNEWADESDSTHDEVKETSNICASSEPTCLSDSHDSNDYVSDEQYYESIKEEFSKIKTCDDYLKVKKMLLMRPNIINFKVDDDNLALDMIVKITNISAINNNSLNDTVLQEIKDFLHRDLIPQNTLSNFLKEKKDIFTEEQFIYLQLCSGNSLLQQKAVDHIKEDHKTLNLSSLLLEEIFFNNLTASFGVSHELYYRILEEVFLNRTLPEIEDNVKLLVKNLVEQRNIPHAIALLNQLEGIPPALSTYGNCFELLLRK